MAALKATVSLRTFGAVGLGLLFGRLGGSGFRVQGSGFRVQGSGFGVWGLGFCLGLTWLYRACLGFTGLVGSVAFCL